MSFFFFVFVKFPSQRSHFFFRTQKTQGFNDKATAKNVRGALKGEVGEFEETAKVPDNARYICGNAQDLLDRAIEMRNVGAVRLLLGKFNASPDAMSRRYWERPLMRFLACVTPISNNPNELEPFIEILELLFYHGADPNKDPLPGVPLFHLAVSTKSSEIVEQFLSAGADRFSKDYAGRSALDLARSMNNQAAIELLENWSDDPILE